MRDNIIVLHKSSALKSSILGSAALTVFLFFILTDAYAATKGRFVGKVNEDAIDVDVMCQLEDKKAGIFNVRSDEGYSYESDTNGDGIVIEVNGQRDIMLAAIINIKGKVYKFGGRDFIIKDSKISYSASLKSKKRGPYEVNFTIDCDEK
jgi:hypothetical protein